MQHERFLAHARAFALSNLKGEAGTQAFLQAQDLEAQLPCPRDIAKRLARILLAVKHAEAFARKSGLEGMMRCGVTLPESSPAGAMLRPRHSACGRDVERLPKFEPRSFQQHGAESPVAGRLECAALRRQGRFPAVHARSPSWLNHERATSCSCRYTATHRLDRTSDRRLEHPATRQPIQAANAPATEAWRAWNGPRIAKISVWNLAPQLQPKIPEHLRIAERAVPGFTGQGDGAPSSASRSWRGCSGTGAATI